MKQLSSRMPDRPTDQPSNARRRLSEVLPQFQALNSSSAANQAKTECRRGEFLEHLVTQKYPTAVAEEHIQFIRDSFTGFNKEIGKLHTGVTRVSRREGRYVKNVGFDNGMSAVDVDDHKDSNYNGDGEATSTQLTAEQEAEDDEHWLQVVNALPKDTTMTEYFIEMGYQLPPSPPKEELKIQDQQEILLPRRRTQSKRWVPSHIKNNKRASLPSPSTAQPFDNASLHNTVPERNVDTTGNLARLVEPSNSRPSMPPLKRAKTLSSSSGRSHFRPKQPPRCASCVQMKKNCDRQIPRGRCSSMREHKVCIPYWRDVQRNLEAEQRELGF
ncbi:hypothetical protein EAE96_002865 [Botrytis aclada]|nr:hypothetical protein EAE96_002865 [Botrytis aclada]